MTANKPSSNNPHSAERLAIGNLVRYARKRNGHSQSVLAAHLGVSFQQVQKYENGKNRIPSDRLAQIAEFLELPITYFYQTSNQQTVEIMPDRATIDVIHRINELPKGQREEVLKLVKMIVGLKSSTPNTPLATTAKQDRTDGDN